MHASYLPTQHPLPTKVLNLRYSKFGSPDASRMLATMLSSMRGLRQLDLSHTQLNDNGMVVLAPALQNLTLLQKLNLFMNNIASVGAKALASVLHTMKSLEHVDLGRNYIKDVTAIRAITAFSEIYTEVDEQTQTSDEEDDQG